MADALMTTILTRLKAVIATDTEFISATWMKAGETAANHVIWGRDWMVGSTDHYSDLDPAQHGIYAWISLPKTGSSDAKGYSRSVSCRVVFELYVAKWTDVTYSAICNLQESLRNTILASTGWATVPAQNPPTSVVHSQELMVIPDNKSIYVFEFTLTWRIAEDPV